MAERVGIAVALALAGLVRVAPVITGGGVVGDGGLILALVDDIRHAGLGLPVTATYNQLEIPFVYPPAALWTAAAAGELSGASTMDLLAVGPPLLSILTVTAFAWLATRLLPPAAAVGATLAYALMPSAYGWLVAAGGLTRAMGLLVALLAMAVAIRSGPIRAGYLRPIGVGALLGLAALCHPQALPFGAAGCLVLTIRKPLASWLAETAVAAATAAVTLLPWLWWVGATNGLDALVGAGQRLEPVTGLIRLLNLEFTGAPFMDVVGALALVGIVVSVLRRAWRVPTFLLVISLMGAGGGEFLAAAPWAVLAGVGVGAVASLAKSAVADVAPRVRRPLLVVPASVALFLALVGSLGSAADSTSKLHPLGDDIQAAMRWMASETEASDPVLVPTGEVWGYDEVSEWLPALAERHSIGTVQGTEWLGQAAFAERLAVHEAIVDCAGQVADCYRDLASDAILFVPKGKLAGVFSPGDCCPALRSTLADAGYQVIYDGPGATIAQSRH